MPRSATANIDVDTGIPVGAAGPRKRWYQLDTFYRKPNLDAAFNVGSTSGGDVGANIERTTEANQHWNLVGDDAVYTDLAFAANGGVTLKTNAGASDQMGIEPLSVATYHIVGGSAVTFPYDKKPAVEFGFTTAASITEMKLWLGFYTALDDPYVHTDDQTDCALVQFVPATSANFNIVNQVNNAKDGVVDTEIEVKASTAYSVKVSLDSAYKAWYWIAEATDLGAGKVFTTPTVHRTGAALIPTLGIEETATTAKEVTVNYAALGRDR